MFSQDIPKEGPIKIQVCGFGYIEGKPLLSVLINGSGPLDFIKKSVAWIDEDGLIIPSEEGEFLDEVWSTEIAEKFGF